MYVKSLHGSDGLMTATVLTAQIVMVPVALLAGRGYEAWGRKAMMAIAFWVLPLRIFSYSLVHTPRAVVWLQGRDIRGPGRRGGNDTKDLRSQNETGPGAARLSRAA